MALGFVKARDVHSGMMLLCPGDSGVVGDSNILGPCFMSEVKDVTVMKNGNIQIMIENSCDTYTYKPDAILIMWAWAQ
jgi:hypothetical protein